jgi:CRP-like cAMP-binding protein
MQLRHPLNQLLSALSQDDFLRFEPHLERVSFSSRKLIEAADEKIQFVYFMEEGLASLIAKSDGHTCLEIGLFGVDGMSGTALLAGDDVSPFDCFAHQGSNGLRMSVVPFIRILDDPKMNRFFAKYARAASLQIAFSALAAAKARLDARLARWLLMANDRLETNKIIVTHETLATLVGAMRPGVTVALQALEGLHLIRSERSRVTIRDRDGLMAVAGSTYGPAEREYRRLTGFDIGRSRDADLAYAPKRIAPLTLACETATEWHY